MFRSLRIRRSLANASSISFQPRHGPPTSSKSSFLASTASTFASEGTCTSKAGDTAHVSFYREALHFAIDAEFLKGGGSISTRSVAFVPFITVERVEDWEINPYRQSSPHHSRDAHAPPRTLGGGHHKLKSAAAQVLLAAKMRKQKEMEQQARKDIDQKGGNGPPAFRVMNTGALKETAEGGAAGAGGGGKGADTSNAERSKHDAGNGGEDIESAKEKTARVIRIPPPLYTPKTIVVALTHQAALGASDYLPCGHSLDSITQHCMPSSYYNAMTHGGNAESGDDSQLDGDDALPLAYGSISRGSALFASVASQQRLRYGERLPLATTSSSPPNPFPSSPLSKRRLPSFPFQAPPSSASSAPDLVQPSPSQCHSLVNTSEGQGQQGPTAASPLSHATAMTRFTDPIVDKYKRLAARLDPYHIPNIKSKGGVRSIKLWSRGEAGGYRTIQGDMETLLRELYKAAVAYESAAVRRRRRDRALAMEAGLTLAGVEDKHNHTADNNFSVSDTDDVSPSLLLSFSLKESFEDDGCDNSNHKINDRMPSPSSSPIDIEVEEAAARFDCLAQQLLDVLMPITMRGRSSSSATINPPNASFSSPNSISSGNNAKESRALVKWRGRCFAHDLKHYGPLFLRNYFRDEESFVRFLIMCHGASLSSLAMTEPRYTHSVPFPIPWGLFTGSAAVAEGGWSSAIRPSAIPRGHRHQRLRDDDDDDACAVDDLVVPGVDPLGSASAVNSASPSFPMPTVDRLLREHVSDKEDGNENKCIDTLNPVDAHRIQQWSLPSALLKQKDNQCALSQSPSPLSGSCEHVYILCDSLDAFAVATSAVWERLMRTEALVRRGVVDIEQRNTLEAFFGKKKTEKASEQPSPASIHHQNAMRLTAQPTSSSSASSPFPRLSVALASPPTRKAIPSASLSSTLATRASRFTTAEGGSDQSNNGGVFYSYGGGDAPTLRATVERTRSLSKEAVDSILKATGVEAALDRIYPLPPSHFDDETKSSQSSPAAPSTQQQQHPLLLSSPYVISIRDITTHSLFYACGIPHTGGKIPKLVDTLRLINMSGQSPEAKALLSPPPPAPSHTPALTTTAVREEAAVNGDAPAASASNASASSNRVGSGVQSACNTDNHNPLWDAAALGAICTYVLRMKR